MRFIYYWPNGDWCYQEDFETFQTANNLSDDFDSFPVPEFAWQDQIENQVNLLVQGQITTKEMEW